VTSNASKPAWPYQQCRRSTEFRSFASTSNAMLPVEPCTSMMLIAFFLGGGANRVASKVAIAPPAHRGERYCGVVDVLELSPRSLAGVPG